MTTYNGTKYIEEQLSSIHMQSIQPDEVLIFDDCSPDENCPRLIQDFIFDHNLDKKWRLINNHINLGWKKNFITGIQQIKGDLIFLADQDDIWDMDKIRTMVDIMQQNENINLHSSNYNILNESRKHIRTNSTQRNFNNNKLELKRFTPKFHLVGRPGCTYCMRREFALKAINAWSDGYAHDKLFWNAAMLTRSLYCINTPLITFRRHGDNASGNGTIKTRVARLKNHELDIAVFKNVCNVFSKEVSNMLAEKNSKTVFNRYKAWLTIRRDFLKNKNIFRGMKLIAYIPFYSSIKSLCADFISK